jgi:hypothetical protein
MSTVVSEAPLETTRVFEPPQVNQDNSRPRYLTCVGSFVTPEVMVQRPWTRGGGIEIANPCLRYARNFLRRGRITPLLRDTHDFLPYDYVRKTLDIDPLSAGYFAQQIPKGYEPPRLPPPNGQGVLMSGTASMGGFSPYGSMVGKLALPGEQINSILNGDDNVNRSNGNRRGVVEFTSLLGHEYRTQLIRLDNGSTIDYDPELWEIQRAIFPDYPNLPLKLDDVAALLDAASVHTSLLSITDTYRQSLDEFRNYVDIYIQNVHQQQRERGPNGYVRPYTAGDLVLLDQIGMERQDRKPQLPSKDRLEEALEQLIALQIEEKKGNIERLQRLESIGQQDELAIDANTMAAAPIATPETEPETLSCECGEYTGNVAGMRMHKNRWCKLKVTESETT